MSACYICNKYKANFILRKVPVCRMCASIYDLPEPIDGTPNAIKEEQTAADDGMGGIPFGFNYDS